MIPASRREQSKLTVLIDIALLGEAQSRKADARGVHRVAEQIVLGLAATGVCNLRFVATSSLAAASRWLEEHPIASAGNLFFRPQQMMLSRWAERASGWIRGTLADRTIHLRGARWLLQRFAVWANSRAADIPASALRSVDIYHSPLGPIPEAARNLARVRKFLTVVDVIPLTNPGSVGGRGVALLSKQLNSVAPDQYIFAISETVKQELLEIKNIAADHVFVTPLAASPEVFHPVTERSAIDLTLERYSLPKTPYFLTLSSFDPRKNFDHVIRCFTRFIQSGKFPDINLVIVGSNPERNAFVEEARRRAPAAAGRIHTPGYIPDEDLAAVYSGAEAFLFPSLSEGFGMPVLEAMSCGAPVISSDAPALPEIVRDAGVLLDPRDEQAWVEGMERIAASPALRAEMAAAGLRRAAEFSWSRFIEATLEGYRAGCAKNQI